MQKEDFRQRVYVHRNKMYRFALAYLKNESEAQDIVQDVLMKLWEAKENLHEIKNMEAWCMTLTRNTCLDTLKRAGRKLNDSFEPHHESGHATSRDPLRIVSEKESVELVKRVAEALPEKQRAAFTLREIQGYSYLEISNIMEVSMDQVKVNIHRARTTIRSELKKHLRSA
jgi:RNA polymerase sigma-70 factor (ECF subfamily)